MSRLILARALAVALITVAFVASSRTASLSADGTRYFWLDDDQMISMQYARNLAHGDGLVWNPGERVEGYTSPGWTLVMAALHVLPIGEAKISLAVKATTWLLACAVVLLAGRLTQLLVPGDTLAQAFVLITLALCRDLLFWAVNGFDTTLVTCVFLLAVVRLLEERSGQPRPWTYVLLGLLPIIRSDAYYVWAGAAVVAVGISKDRRQALRWLALSLVLPAMHIGWRRWYYGAWLPNTFYIKASAGLARWTSAIAYLKGFVGHYAAPLVVAGITAWRAPGGLRGWLLMSGLAGVAYVCSVGADMYGLTRFLAYFIPVLVVLAAVGTVTRIVDRFAAGTVLMAISLSTLFQVGITGPRQFGELASGNGNPDAGLVVALTIRDNTPPTATVAVVAAGVVPYFSHRRALDFMGLSDAYIAHLPPHPGAPLGHMKYDVAYTLSQTPDLVVRFWAGDPSPSALASESFDAAVLTDPTFRDHYAGHFRDITTAVGSSRLYASDQSPTARRLDEWRVPNVSR